MQALEVISGGVTAQGATPGNITMFAGDSLQVKQAAPGSRIFLLCAWSWTQNVETGIVSIRSPRLHDNVNGYRYRVNSQLPYPYTPDSSVELVSQDTLVVQASGSAVALDQETHHLMLYYENLLGTAARFIDPKTLAARAVANGLVTNETQHTAGTTAQTYSGQLALNANFDLLKANTDYAILGYMVNVQQGGIFFRGPDTGNIRVGGPGLQNNKDLTRNWFVYLSMKYGKALIPVISSANKGATFIDVANNENAASPVVTTILQQLR